MTTLPTQDRPVIFTNGAISSETIVYYSRRLRSRVFDEMLRAFSEAIDNQGMTRAKLAKRIGVKPEQITRWFSAPSNYTLDTVAKILVGLEAELDPKVVFFRDRHLPNYAPSTIDFISAPGTQITTSENKNTATVT